MVHWAQVQNHLNCLLNWTRNGSFKFLFLLLLKMTVDNPPCSPPIPCCDILPARLSRRSSQCRDIRRPEQPQLHQHRVGLTQLGPTINPEFTMYIQQQHRERAQLPRDLALAVRRDGTTQIADALLIGAKPAPANANARIVSGLQAALMSLNHVVI
jgi:hypothetical protein